MAKKKTKAFMEDSVQRMVLAAVAGGKILGEAFTKGFDTYIEKHEASEKKEEGGWFGDLLTNSAKSMEELIRHLSKLPKEVVDTYLEEEEEEEEEEEVTKSDKEESGKNENKPPRLKPKEKP